MKRSISLFIIPTLAATVVAMALHTFIPFHQAVNMDQLSTPAQYNTVFAFCGLLFGFIPCLIYGMAHHWMEANRPAPADQVALEPQQQEQEIYILTASRPQLCEGMTFTSTGANCQLRIKKLKQ